VWLASRASVSYDLNDLSPELNNKHAQHNQYDSDPLPFSDFVSFTNWKENKHGCKYD
jgi:hypothetical protein